VISLDRLDLLYLHVTRPTVQQLPRSCLGLQGLNTVRHPVLYNHGPQALTPELRRHEALGCAAAHLLRTLEGQ